MSKILTQERLEGKYHELAARDFDAKLYDGQKNRLGEFMRDWLTTSKRFGSRATRVELCRGWRDIHQVYLDSLKGVHSREDFRALEAVIYSTAESRRLIVIQARQEGVLGFKYGLLQSDQSRLQSLEDLVLARDRKLVFRQFIGRTSWRGLDDHTDRLKMGVLRTIEEADTHRR